MSDWDWHSRASCLLSPLRLLPLLILTSPSSLVAQATDGIPVASSACLLQLGSRSAAGGAHHDSAELHESSGVAGAKKVVPATWFGGFSKGESTFDPDGMQEHPENPDLAIAARLGDAGNSVMMGGQETPDYVSQNGLPEDWFEESASAGPSAAWRTRFPPVEAFRSEGMRTVPWLPDHSGRRKQTYVPATATSIARAFDMTKKKDANWFDESIEAYDDFGRNVPPSEWSERFFWDWEKKSWSVPLGCADPGCIANASLKTFDSKKLQHARCTLNVGVHVTDYDDEYSREFVEFIIVNDNHVNTRCDPMGKGCNTSVATKDRGLHPCITDYPLDNMLRKDTELKFAAKISEMVDECPVDNNLLSGQATVTCMVKPWPSPTKPPIPVIIPDNETEEPCPNSTSLQCYERGCIANTTASVCKAPKEGEKCLMSVKIWQTDFDQDHGSKELVEWVKVNGDEVAKDLKPGRNPCKEVWEGKPATKESLAQQNPTTTPEPGIGLDAQSAALLAHLPDEEQVDANCRRRVNLNPASFLKESDEPPVRRQTIRHLRAEPDDMKEIVSNQDVTDQILANQTIYVEAKISKMVDECAKDGYLLNAEVFIECK